MANPTPIPGARPLFLVYSGGRMCCVDPEPILPKLMHGDLEICRIFSQSFWGETEGLREERTTREREHGVLVIPADGHDWKKYGQKFIRNIGKTRSYFRCQKKKCGAKKRVEWSASNPADNHIIYEGEHTHLPCRNTSDPDQQGSSREEAASAASGINQYDLYTQYFGDQNYNNS